MSHLPLISVIVASKNAAKTIQRCVDSFAAQDYPHRELIVMDGASQDGTREILEKNFDKISYWRSELDGGIYPAWNKALDQAKGEWICFLGADDFLWSPQTLGVVAPFLASSFPKYRVVYGRVAVVSSSSEVLQTVGDDWEKSSRLIQHELTIPHQGVFQHRSLFEDHGRFDESFRITGDYDFLLRELKDHPAYFIPGVTVAGMQIGGISSLLSNTLLNISELRRARRNNGLGSVSYPLLKREVRARVRKGLEKVLGRSITHWIADTYRVITGKRRIWTKGW